MIYKAFSVPSVCKLPFNFKKSLTSNMSNIRGTASLKNLPFKYAVRFEDIRDGSVVFRRSAKTFETNFVSLLRRETGLHFLISCLSLSLFSINLITVCF